MPCSTRPWAAVRWRGRSRLARGAVARAGRRGHGGAVAARQRPLSGSDDLPTRCCRCDPRHTGAAAGHKLDLREVTLDMTQVSDFHQRVVAVTRAIPPGQVRTYGDIAEQLGSKGLSTRRGPGAGPEPVCARGALPPGAGCGFQAGGFSATGGTATKLRMLQIEGLAGATPKRCLAFDKCRDRQRSKKSPMGARHIGLSVFLSG